MTGILEDGDSPEMNEGGTLTDRLERAACRQKVTDPCLERALSEEETFASSLLPELPGPGLYIHVCCRYPVH